MADDLVDAETTLLAQQGPENHPYGVVLVRVVRLLRQARQKFQSTDDRIAALEARVTNLGG